MNRDIEQQSATPAEPDLNAKGIHEPKEGMTLDAGEVQFLATRLRRLFKHFDYPLPKFADDSRKLIGIAPSCIGAVLANLNTPADAASEAEKRDAERYRMVRRGQHWSVVDGIGNTLRAEELDSAVDIQRERQQGAGK